MEPLSETGLQRLKLQSARCLPRYESIRFSQPQTPEKMKNYYTLSIIFLLLSGNFSAQVIEESVSVGPGYANQLWYSLQNGDAQSQPKGNWDIAFDCTPFGTSILINSVGGTRLWNYPGSWGDFDVLDTTGIHNWTERFNSDTSWALGAFSRNGSGLHLGWGAYNTITHVVSGDSLFVIQLTSGALRKVRIEQLASGTYTFREASLDNTHDATHTLAKSDYPSRNFGYFDLANQQAVDREPLREDWDLLFGQYTAFIPVPYAVAGVLHNLNTQVAQAYPVSNPSSYTQYGDYNFETAINTIGYDWKQFTGFWNITDSLVYFVKTQHDEIWKVVFTGFGGMANGTFEFTKELLVTASVNNLEQSFGLQLYPNPASTLLNVVFDQPTGTDLQLDIVDMTGKQLISRNLQSEGLSTETVDVSDLKTGMYLVTLRSPIHKQTSKLIIR